MDLFDLLGPVMVGPSSSHTAGAVRIGLACRRLLGEEPTDADITLYGSFAATGRGHGTDRAIVAGLLGMKPDDTLIPDSFHWAREAGMQFSFTLAESPQAHPNTARVVLRSETGKSVDVEAASIGGGRIEIRRLGDMPLRFSAEQPTILIRNVDRPGYVAEVSRVLSEARINIATFQVNRDSRGGEAIMVIECDDPISDELVEKLRTLRGILSAVAINP